MISGYQIWAVGFEPTSLNLCGTVPTESHDTIGAVTGIEPAHSTPQRFFLRLYYTCNRNLNYARHIVCKRHQSR